MSEIEGYVERVVYRNEENGYSVLTVMEGSKERCLVGFFPFVSEGEFLVASGEMTKHPMYGEQMKVSEYHFSAPSDAVSTQRYLGSGAVKGIGQAMAERIVKKFGDDTFRIIEEEPERLAEIKGISERKAMEIAAVVAEKRDARKAMLFLQQYGISLNLAAKIYHTYGPRLYTVVKENPYQLADDITGVGFKAADEIARKVGIHTDSDFRIRSGLYYTLLQAVGQGHTYLPEEQLLKETAQMLQVPEDGIDKHIMDMVIDKKLIVKVQNNVKTSFHDPDLDARRGGQTGVNIRIVYASLYYYMELNIAKMLHDLNICDSIPAEVIRKNVSEIESGQGIVLDEIQREAVTEAINHGLTIITGGPGTGKTTTINTIIQYFEREGLDILLAAPTGRAAKRMTEATGFEAQTIHRLLELTGGMDTGALTYFTRNEENPLEADVVIIDEVSMVDIHLMHALLKAVSVGMRLVLVGDVNQLPSVGPGNILKDVIRSECFPVVKLQKIFRQASESDIIINAHKINAGEVVEPKKGSKDFLFVQRQTPENVIGAMVTLVREKLPGYVNADIHEIQVLTPMRKGALGVEQLNLTLQQYLNPPSTQKKERNFGDVIFREGDKVMQIKNNYQIEWEVLDRHHLPVERGVGVFNGDMGVIREINHFTEQMAVEFDERRRVLYSFKQLEELELAYAVTIHKSQGSEYPAVVIPLLSGPRMLMNRNLLYTAVTRAKTCVCIVGNLTTFQEMIDNEQEQKRYSGLAERISELYQMDL